MKALGVVSAALEADIRKAMIANKVLFWLDLDGAYTAFVDGLTAMRDELPYTVAAYRGSFLELLFQLEHVSAGVDPSPLLVHLPGFNEDTVKASPLFEQYAPGTRYRKALETLVQEAAAGLVKPEQIEAFRQQGSLTLDGADAWLTSMVGNAADGLAAQLRTMTLEAVVDDLLGGGYLSTRTGNPTDLAALWDHMAKTTGLTNDWRDESLDQGPTRARDVAYTAASWALAVEYVNDLARPPVELQLAHVRALPRNVADSCHKLAEHLRTRHVEFYKNTANETQHRLPGETAAIRAEDLGKIDTFLFEEEAILTAAMGAMGSGNFDLALTWAEPRTRANSFWLAQEPPRQNAWLLVLDAARLGKAIQNSGAGFKGCNSLDAALDRYVSKGAAVDQAHRILEQRRTAVLYPQVTHFETLRTRLDEMRARWRDWADTWAKEWNAVCRAHGFLPSSEMQQRGLFEQVVRPLATEAGATAYFVVDALRYEMAEELFRALEDTPATQVQLKARLAELPTVTEVGMNVLAPVVDNGKLRPALDGGSIKGFSTGEFRVSTPETRRRAMADRVGGQTCPWLDLDEVLKRDATKLKEMVTKASLIVVHSREVDEAGEKGVGPSVFDKVLQDIRAAWRLLREAGVQRFVITADHGFLMLDERMGDAKAHGRKIDPKRRHVFSPVAADHTGEVRVALADLGYEGVEGHLMFPDTVTVFDTGARGGSFVHGGNSPQERVIPVLTLVHRARAGSDTQQYVVVAKAAEGIAGMHCIEARVNVTEQMNLLGFGASKTVELGLTVVGARDVVLELCQARRGAKLGGSVIHAEVGAEFDLFFRLTGPTDERVRVELSHSGGQRVVQAAVIESRFSVQAVAGRAATPRENDSGSRDWLLDMPGDDVRAVFEHLWIHGAVTESELFGMMGTRGARQFSRKWEELAKQAPFRVSIETVAGVKRYVREGGEP